MSTRSNIAIENMKTGEVTAIYCHFDGYPEGVGQTLLLHWSEPNKVRKLIALGSISVLGDEIGETLAYGRDRDEAKTYATVSDYFESGKESWAEYLYLYHQGVWFYAEPGGPSGPSLVRTGSPFEIWRPVL